MDIDTSISIPIKLIHSGWDDARVKGIMEWIHRNHGEDPYFSISIGNELNEFLEICTDLIPFDTSKLKGAIDLLGSEKCNVFVEESGVEFWPDVDHLKVISQHIKPGSLVQDIVNLHNINHKMEDLFDWRGINEQFIFLLGGAASNSDIAALQKDDIQQFFKSVDNDNWSCILRVYSRSVRENEQHCHHFNTSYEEEDKTKCNRKRRMSE